MTAQWWQVLYTSSDDEGSGPGGWGIKQAKPESARDDAEFMLAGADTRLGASTDIGNFPTAEVLQARPRQLTARWRAGHLFLSHVVPAGSDSTGRPGNVVIHAAARLAETQSLAIEYWRSSDWLEPFGPQGVRTAVLPDAVQVGHVLTRARTAAFLAEKSRLAIVSVLMEALQESSGDDSSVALLVDSDEEAADWIAAISFLRDPRFDHEVSWTTAARPDSVGSLRQMGVRLLAVARSDERELEAQSGPAQLVVDPARPPTLVDGAWQVGRGIVGAGVATEVLRAVGQQVSEFGVGLLTDVLEAVAEISADSSPDARDPVWALALAVLADPDLAIVDRAGVTTQVLLDGARQQRPRRTEFAIDRWWRSDPETAKRSLDGSSVIAELTLCRRVALLLAGELAWDDEIDGRRELSEHSRASLAQTVERASERLAKLTQMANGAGEAEQMTRVFDTYGLAMPRTPLPRQGPSTPEPARPATSLAKHHVARLTPDRPGDTSVAAADTSLAVADEWVLACRRALDYGDPARYQMAPADAHRLQAGLAHVSSRALAEAAAEAFGRLELLTLVRALVQAPGDQEPWSPLRVGAQQGELSRGYAVAVFALAEVISVPASDVGWWERSVKWDVPQMQTVFQAARAEISNSRRMV